MIFTARVPEEITPAMDKAKASGATALNVLTSAMFSFNRRIVIERARLWACPRFMNGQKWRKRVV